VTLDKSSNQMCVHSYKKKESYTYTEQCLSIDTTSYDIPLLRWIHVAIVIHPLSKRKNYLLRFVEEDALDKKSDEELKLIIDHNRITTNSSKTTSSRDELFDSNTPTTPSREELIDSIKKAKRVASRNYYYDYSYSYSSLNRKPENMDNSSTSDHSADDIYHVQIYFDSEFVSKPQERPTPFSLIPGAQLSDTFDGTLAGCSFYPNRFLSDSDLKLLTLFGAPSSSPFASLASPAAKTLARRVKYFTSKIVHSGFTCDGCNTYPIHGVRFNCQKGCNFDLCETCFWVRRNTIMPSVAPTHTSDHVWFRACLSRKCYYLVQLPNEEEEEEE